MVLVKCVPVAMFRNCCLKVNLLKISLKSEICLMDLCCVTNGTILFEFILLRLSWIRLVLAFVSRYECWFVFWGWIFWRYSVKTTSWLFMVAYIGCSSLMDQTVWIWSSKWLIKKRWNNLKHGACMCTLDHYL